MKKSLIWVIVVIIVILALVYFGGLWPKKASQENQLPDQNEDITGAESFSVELFMKNESGQAGWAIFTKEADGTKIVVNSWGFPESREQPADIRSGSCEESGAQKYALNHLAGGKSETIISESIDDILSQSPVAINLYRSNQDKQVVSCGSIQ